MRWIFAVLLLANVALFMWGRWYHKPLVDTEPPPPRPDVAAEKMKLLSEPGVRLTLRTRNSSGASPADDAAARCYQLGPFATLDKARVAGATLDAWGLAYTRVAEFETLGPAYRVYVPSLGSKDAAERRRRELSKLGFTDHALIQDEEGMENAISLGIFTVERNARARVAELARKGVKASIQPIPNVQPAYWLALSAQAGNGQIGGTPLARFSQEDWGASNVGLRSAYCDGVRAPSS